MLTRTDEHSVARLDVNRGRSTNTDDESADAVSELLSVGLDLPCARIGAVGHEAGELDTGLRYLRAIELDDTFIGSEARRRSDRASSSDPSRQ